MLRGLYWYRFDLRITDNPALSTAVNECDELAIIYILDKNNAGEWEIGSASKWWLHYSLAALHKQLVKRDSILQFFIGDSNSTLLKICEKFKINSVYWNRTYEPNLIIRDKEIKKCLTGINVKVKSFNSTLFYEPWDSLKNDGTPYKVFTPFWKHIQKKGLPSNIYKNINSFPRTLNISAVDLDSYELLPRSNWADGLKSNWKPGELGAKQRFKIFKETALNTYSDARDFPSKPMTSKLSPHLHFGEISSRFITTQLLKNQNSFELYAAFIRQLVWREFAYHLLFHYQEMATVPLNTKYNRFPWATNYHKQLSAWQKGLTGIPLVDAGMRELWKTGWMHNRIRMIVGSFLTKNLLIPWQEGAKWFWNTLVDADLANNSFAWQWITGCGADASPYYRIFNPILQSKKFDPEGKYIRKWIPELTQLSDKFIHAPWEASFIELKNSGVILAKNYPRPIVDLQGSRNKALQAYKEIR